MTAAATPPLSGRADVPWVDVGGTPVSFLATARDTAGALSVTEHRLPGNAPGAPPHFHREMTEMFYVVAGRVRLSIDGAERTEGAGGFLLVPPGTAHAFGNPSSEPATLLVISTPNRGRERYFEQLAELLRTPGEPRREVIGRLALAFDQYPAETGDRLRQSGYRFGPLM